MHLEGLLFSSGLCPSELLPEKLLPASQHLLQNELEPGPGCPSRSSKKPAAVSEGKVWFPEEQAGVPAGVRGKESWALAGPEPGLVSEQRCCCWEAWAACSFPDVSPPQEP